MNEPSWIFSSALGAWVLAWSSQGVRGLRPAGEALPETPENAPPWVVQTVANLRAHLVGSPGKLGSIPLDNSGFTPFQLKVADILRASAPGQTLTYGEIAFLAGRPGAARAVGQAVRRNPVLLLVPCHRVVSATGPGGWSAFGSPDIKERLLALERPDNGINVPALP